YDVLTVEASADQGGTWVPLPGHLEAEHEERVEVPDGQITGWGLRTVWDGTFPLSAVGAPPAGAVQIRLRLRTDRSTRGLGAWVGRRGVLEMGQELFDSDRAADRREVVADGWALGGWPPMGGCSVAEGSAPSGGRAARAGLRPGPRAGRAVTAPPQHGLVHISVTRLSFSPSCGIDRHMTNSQH